MKKNLISVAVATAMGIAAFSASAEDMYRGAWYAVPGVSYISTDNDLNANNGGGAFIKLGKELSESWDIQGGLGYNTSKESGIPGADGRYKQTTLGLDALYMFSRSNFRPFVLAGLGVARNKLDYTIPAPLNALDQSKTSWLANVGVGAQYLINDSFGLQADIRQQWSRARGGLVDTVATGVNNTDTISNTLFSLGGVFRFGAPAPMPVVEAAPEPAPVAAPAPVVAEPEPTPAPVAPAPCEPKFETITLSAERLFGFDKYKLNGDGVAELDEVVAKLKAHPEFDVVVVTGHTDRIGSEQYNQKLSEKRAEVIKQHLVSHDIDASRIQAVGKGESEPVVSCKGVRGKKLIQCLEPNRRVVISGERLHPINECK